MTIYIGGFHQQLGSVKSITVNGRPGCGLYVLIVGLEIEAGNLREEAFISQLNCRIELDQENLVIGNGVQEGQPILRWGSWSTVERCYFHFFLDAKQLEEIEKRRGADNLRLNLWLSGVTEYEGGKESFCDKNTFVISKQEWNESLNAMKFQNSILFEIPLLDSNDQGPQVKGMINKAQSHILNGHYDEAVGICRQLIEWLEEFRDDRTRAKDAVKQYKLQRQDMTLDQRMLFARESVKNIMHTANHLTAEGNFSRSQALTILGMTVALLSSPEVGMV